jgi:hypothetical protein
MGYAVKELIEKNLQSGQNAPDDMKKIIKFYNAYAFASVVTGKIDTEFIANLNQLFAKFAKKRSSAIKTTLDKLQHKCGEIINESMDILKDTEPEMGVEETITRLKILGCVGVEAM